MCLHYVTANFICVAYGTVSGWPSASFPELMSETDSPMPDGLPLNMEQLSWVGSSMAIGALFGNSFFSWLADRCGRKMALLYSAFPTLVSLIAIGDRWIGVDGNVCIVQTDWLGFADIRTERILPVCFSVLARTGRCRIVCGDSVVRVGDRRHRVSCP